MAQRRRVTGRVPTGVFWGRFNPPHRGHLSVARRFAKRCRLVVAIGGSERSHTATDPFSGRERKAMMEAYLDEAGIRGVRVVALEDGPSVAWSLRNLIRRCEPDLLFLSDEKRGLIRQIGRTVPVVRFRRKGRVSSTLIRNLVAAGDPGWKRYTGRSVAELVERMGGVERIRRAYRSRGTRSRTGWRQRGKPVGRTRGGPTDVPRSP